MAGSPSRAGAVGGTRVRARKRFGQHFLTDPTVIERIFGALRLNATQRALEIGAGTGTLTGRLCAEAGTVIAIEIDRDLAVLLRARYPNVTVVCADVLSTDLTPYVSTDQALRIIGNLPYNVATPLLDRLFGIVDEVADMHFMLQAEVADRLTASPGSKSYGRLSVIAQYHCRIEQLFPVDAASFAPTPKVQSAFVRLSTRQREPCDIAALRNILRTAFSQRRKTLANALKSVAPDWQALTLDPRARPENLTVRDFVAIANQVAAKASGTARGQTSHELGPVVRGK